MKIRPKLLCVLITYFNYAIFFELLVVRKRSRFLKFALAENRKSLIQIKISFDNKSVSKTSIFIKLATLAL